MGTRCITEVRSKWGQDSGWKTNAVIYRHWDGYLSGHGKWLFGFLDDMKVINGIPATPPKKFANGPGRLAAQLVYEMQKDGSDPKLMTGLHDCGQEYHYRIDIDFEMVGGTIEITVFDGPMTAFGFGGDQCTNKLFSGSIEEYGKFLEKEAKENA